MPDRQTHDTAAALFLRLADAPPAEREEALAAEPDPAVREAVAALLRGHEAESGVLDDPLDVLRRKREEAEIRVIGREVGPWRIIGRLGSGGMGAVYRAERSDGLYEREVALKLLAPGAMLAGGEWLARRLAAERRILARLEHPGIARLYDGGVTAEGLPYLAMQLVDGVPITIYADAHGLSVRDRVALAAHVCDAVAYAHQRLVVHRDLKPSNILVTEAGAPVLLDFGVASLIDEDEMLTQTRLSMTPAYAAPEQVTGGEVTTATDVYALGVLLYRLLAGRRPYDLAGATAARAERVITAEVPPPPSAAARETAARETAAREAAAREVTAPPDTPTATASGARPPATGPSPAARARALRGDLDTVVLRALEKEPARRYPTAQALGDDLRRHLAGLPVEARPATAAYRVGRFVRRHRVLAGAGLVALAAVLGGAGLALWQAREADRARDRAEARFAIAQDAARAMLYDVHDAIAQLPGATPARETIVEQSLTYLDRLAEGAGDAPALRLDLAGAYFRIANVQGNPTDNNLGRPTDAIASYRRGLALLPAPAALPDSLARDALTLAGRLHEKLGVTLAHAASPDSALPHLDRALAFQRRALALAPSDPEAVTYLATAHINRGDYTGHPYFPNVGRPDSALAHYERALTLLERIPERDRTLFARRMHAITFEREANLLRDRGRLADALGPARQSLALRESLAADPDAGTEARRDVGVSREALGLLLSARGEHAEAVRQLTAAVAVYRDLLDADPASVAAQRTLAFGHLQAGRVFVAAGGRAEGRRHLAEAARLFDGLAGTGDGDWRRLAQQAREERAAA